MQVPSLVAKFLTDACGATCCPNCSFMVSTHGSVVPLAMFQNIILGICENFCWVFSRSLIFLKLSYKERYVDCVSNFSSVNNFALRT